jgi:hypothetical protein
LHFLEWFWENFCWTHVWWALEFSLLGKNIYLSTSNTCSWRIMHCIKHLQRALQAPPPNLHWQSWLTYIHWHTYSRPTY